MRVIGRIFLLGIIYLYHRLFEDEINRFFFFLLDMPGIRENRVINATAFHQHVSNFGYKLLVAEFSGDFFFSFFLSLFNPQERERKVVPTRFQSPCESVTW